MKNMGKFHIVTVGNICEIITYERHMLGFHKYCQL